MSNSGWLMFDKLVRILTSLFVGTWVARYLGPQDFGHFAYILAYLAMFQAIATLGADGIVVRDISRRPEAAGQILGTTFVLRLMAGLTCWGLAVLGSVAANGAGLAFERDILLITLAGSTLIFQAADTVDLWFQSQSQSRRTVAAKLTAYIFSNGIKVILILAKAPLAAFVAVIALDAMFAAIGLAIVYRAFRTAGRWRLMLSYGRELLRDSWPFLLSTVSVMVYMRVDQIMVRQIGGEVELGIYAAALQISQVWQVIPMTLVISLAPLVAKRKQQSQVDYERLLLAIFRTFGFMSIFAACVTALSSDFLVGLLFGKSFDRASGVLSALVFSNVFVFLGVAQSLWLVNESKTWIVYTRTIVGALVSVTVNLVTIPRFGALGAAMSANLSYALSAVLLNMLFAPRVFLMQLGIKPRQAAA